jgi:putative membrane protein
VQRLMFVLTAFAIVAFASVSLAADESKPKDDKNKDHAFVTKAMVSGEMEVALGKLAASKGSTDEVKKFGQQMVDDHTKANDELKSIVSSKNIDTTKVAEQASKQSQKAQDKLGGKEGSDFDKAYVDLMVSEHEKDVKLFKKESEGGEDAELKAFAAKTLPNLEHHLQMAKDLQTKVGTK